jgi:hypothetical protein
MQGTELQAGDRLPRLLGYEADRSFGNAQADITILAQSAYMFEDRPHLAHMASYSLPTGTTVFATGTIQWSWGLDDFNAPHLRKSSLNPHAQQITRNVLHHFRRSPALQDR